MKRKLFVALCLALATIAIPSLSFAVLLDAALDTTAYTWTTGGTNPWFGETLPTHDGIDAAQSGVIGNSQSTWLKTSVTGPGTLSFWWKVSSESGYDFLRFDVDGVAQPAVPGISGAVGWVQVTGVQIPSGAHSIRWTYAKDGSGISGSDAGWLDQVVYVMTDGVFPTVTAFSIPATSASLTVPVTAFDGTDNVGVTGYLLTEAATTPLATASGWSSTAPTSYAFPVSGSRTLYAWVKDAVGNVSASLNAQVAIEAVPPVVSDFTMPATSTSLTVPVTTLLATDNGSLAGYLLNESSTKPAASSSGWSTSAPTTYTFAASGARTVYAWAKDAAGNVSASKSAQVNIENTIPIVTAFCLPATGTSIFIPITTFAATDNTAVTGYLISESSATPSANAANWSSDPCTSYIAASSGTKQLYAWAKDAAGNVSSYRAASISIETVTPTVTTFALPVSSTSLEVPVTSFAATDNVGVAGYAITEAATVSPYANWSATPPTSYTFSSNGAKTLYAWARDAAWNISSFKSASVTVDTVAPSVATCTIPAYSTGLSVPITSFTATDNVGVSGYLINESAIQPSPTAAGWTVAAPASYACSTSGPHTLYAWVKDAAGNVSASKSGTVNIDTTIPSITEFALPATSTSLTVAITTFTATDDNTVTGYLLNESGVKPAASASGWSNTAPANYTFSTSASRYLYAWVKDAAGNVSLSKAQYVSVDAAPPSITAFVLPAYSTTLVVPIQIFSAGDNIGITGYLINEQATPPSLGLEQRQTDTVHIPVRWHQDSLCMGERCGRKRVDNQPHSQCGYS